jgi:hypothetical protein
MNTLRITFQPDMAPSPIEYHELSTNDPDVQRRLWATGVEVDTILWLDQLRFGYYPAPLITTLSELEYELDLFNHRADHFWEMSGFPVLEVKFEADFVSFFDPIDTARLGDHRIAVGRVSAYEAIGCLKMALNAVWHFFNMYQLEQSDEVPHGSASPVGDAELGPFYIEASGKVKPSS